MRRITVTLEDSLVDLAEADVAAGRAPSVSAWVADAIRAKAQARAELVADLEALEERDPASREALDSIARAVGLPRTVVAGAVRGTRARTRARRAR